MSKKIIFSLLPLAIFLTLSAAHAAEQPADPSAADPVTAQTLPVDPDASISPQREAMQQPASDIRPNNDNLVDYRYCLELKTNQEIAECRYKKK